MIRIATLNLYHWAEPGIGWYEGDHGYTEPEWALKRRWLADALAEMDADIVGLQEVVSVRALAEVGRAAGYPVCATVAEPEIDMREDGARRYQKPVNAILSRAPAAVSTVAPRRHLAHALGLKEGRHFRRPPVVVEATLDGLGPVVVLCAHLKSPGANPRDVSIAGDAPAEGAPPASDGPADRARKALEGLSRSHAYATIQRLYEATSLYHDAAERLAAAPSRPLFLLGDFNATPFSPALRALTPYRAQERDGGRAADPEGDREDGVIDDAAPWRLVDALRLTPRALGADGRANTHRRGAEGDVIDFILVSAALHPWNPERVGDVVAHRVHDGWFIGSDPKTTSDHAGVSVAIAPRR